jgi:starch phosphorylase
VPDKFESYLRSESSWFQRFCRDKDDKPLIAYFSTEFGLAECLSIFAGGLGILAGDRLKSASDLGIPLIGVGLLYQQGYFRQYLNQAGWQQESYEDNDFHNLPISPVSQPDGKPLILRVEYPGRSVSAQVWRAQVGRIPLYLLDTNIAANQHIEDRDITNQLYGGDREMRLKQEILLGIGGYRALKALGLEPSVYHMNEGHSAFLALERIRHLMETTNSLSHKHVHLPHPVWSSLLIRRLKPAKITSRRIRWTAISGPTAGSWASRCPTSLRLVALLPTHNPTFA